MKTLNDRTVTLKAQRRDLIDLQLACSMILGSTDDENTVKKWTRLHDLIAEQVREFDEKNGL